MLSMKGFVPVNSAKFIDQERERDSQLTQGAHLGRGKAEVDEGGVRLRRPLRRRLLGPRVAPPLVLSVPETERDCVNPLQS